MKYSFFAYLSTMALATYFIRMIPLVAVKKKINNQFILSFLHYIPFSVLSVMTIPAIFNSTDSYISAIIGFSCAVITSFLNLSLIKVASMTCLIVFITEYFLKFI